MPIELKPCPFCGGEAHYVKCSDGEAWVRCKDCGTETAIFDSVEEAAEAWNRRADDATD